MDYQTITSLIGGVGFPIVACLGMAYFINKTYKELTRAINNNSMILKCILTKLDIKEEDIK